MGAALSGWNMVVEMAVGWELLVEQISAGSFLSEMVGFFVRHRSFPRRMPDGQNTF